MEKERKEQGKLLNRKLTTVLNYRFDENSWPEKQKGLSPALSYLI